MERDEFERQVAGLAALDDPARRSLYFYVANRQREVGRDEAAQAVGVSHSLAGFHLDRLAAEGLLEVSFRRLSGRTGPGAGRPAKLYRRASRQVDISLPARRYELAAQLLATAIDSSNVAQTRRALDTTARALGRKIGLEARARSGPRAGKKRLLAGAVAALAAHGYEPEQADGEVLLRNCPFHALVSDHTQLVCGMNLALIEGVIDGLALPGATPVLDPAPGRCCVCLRLGTKRA